MKKKSQKVSKKIVGASALGLVIVVALLVVLNRKTHIPHSNPIDTQISLNTNRQAPQSAIETDPEFQNLAFEMPPADQPSFFGHQIAAAVKAVQSWFSSEDDQKTRERGTWIWTPTLQMTPAYMESVISEAAEHGINTIYVSIDSYLDIFTMAKGPTREAQKQKFENVLENFIKIAAQKGVAVDAEAGWSNWAEEGNEYKGLAIANFVKNFNETKTHKFRGFQYDVEPYLLEEFKQDPGAVLKNFVTLIDKTERFLGGSSLTFSVVIPDFYDENDKMTPPFEYAGKKASALKHLLNILDRREGSSIVIMSYRAFAAGHDGSIEVSENELRTADRGGHRTKIIIAQETGDVPPPYITFHRTSKKYLSEQIDRINAAFHSSPNFGGVAIHYINAFLALK